jgi:hypothetical protein
VRSIEDRAGGENYIIYEVRIYEEVDEILR